MATMHPTDLENYNYTASEKQMYDALKEQLPDKMQVFYSVRWFEKNEQDKRVDSESDFLIFDPMFGYITLEVKGGEKIEVNDNTWILTEYDENHKLTKRELKCSPYEQAEKSMRHFYNYFKAEFNQSFQGVYGSAVAFPRYYVDQSLNHDAPKELTIDLSDMDNLKKKINEIFHYWRNRRNIGIPFSADQKKKLIQSINKRISLSAAAGALIPIKEKQFEKINFFQEGILDVLFHYHQVQILGGAGTGKTYLALKKAKRDATAGKKVLILCCNKELIRTTSYRFSEFSNVDCHTFESLMKAILGDEYYSTPLNSHGCHCCFDILQGKDDLLKYDSILVDEAQDFDVDMGLSVRGLLRDDNNSDLYVFYDINQNVFSDNYENAFAIDNPPFILRYNIRNTGNIYSYATEQTQLGKDTIANTLLGVKPEVQNYNNVAQTLKALTGIVNRLTQKEYVSTKSIVILSDKKYEESILNNSTRVGSFDVSFKDLRDVEETELCFKTVEQFKGLEADIVIYLTRDHYSYDLSDIERRKEYVALTRARYYLYILNTK